jgi:hypothetical protein
MGKMKQRPFVAFSLVLALILLVTACVPGGQLPVTGGPTPTSAVSENVEDSGIPVTGEVAQPTPGDTSGLQHGGEVSQPVARLTVTDDLAVPGGEIVVQGQGFEPGAAIRIFAGRPDAEGDRLPLVTTSAGEDGRFSAHLVLPVDLPADAVTAGQLLLTATAREGTEIIAMTIVQTSGMGPSGGEPTREAAEEAGGSAEDTDGLAALTFDAYVAILPVLINSLGGDFDQESVVITAVEEREWGNGCLGLAEEDEICTQQIVPGYLLTVKVEGREYHLRTNQDGTQVRLERDLGGSYNP